MNVFKSSLLIALLIIVACNSGTDGAKEEEVLLKNNKELFGEIIDLTHSFSEETVYWVTAKEFELEEVFKGETDKGFFYAANNFATAEHGGTHIDAPIHFAKNGQTVDEIPLSKLVGRAIKINVSDKTQQNPDYLISIEDLQNWEDTEKMTIPNGRIVLLQTGFSNILSG